MTLLSASLTIKFNIGHSAASEDTSEFPYFQIRSGERLDFLGDERSDWRERGGGLPQVLQDHPRQD